MELINVIIIVVLYVEIFHCVQAQVTFDPDRVEDVKLQQTIIKHPVNVTTVQCYQSPPEIKVEYVTENGNEGVYDVYDDNNTVIFYRSKCGEEYYQYNATLYNLRFINEPVLVGGTFKLKATVNNNEGNFTLSRRTYSFPAPFNLTRSTNSAVLNFTFSWTCHVTSDYPVIEWFRDNTNLGQSGIRNRSCVSFEKNNSYIYTCQESALKYTLTIPGPSLTEALQGSLWRCKDVYNETKGSKFMELDIIIPVTSVTISPGSTLHGDENQTVTFVCITNNAKPPPIILWFIDPSDVASQAGINKTTLNLTLSRAYHKMAVRCLSWNSGNSENKSASATLNVRYPPADNETLQIFGYTNGQVLYQNTPAMINISCRQPGGNPVVNITFKCGTDAGHGMMDKTATEAKVRLTLTNDRNLNDQQCVCTSTHINGYKRNINMSFVVYYPPSSPNITASSSFPWKAPGNYSLACNNTQGNPPATTYIWKEGLSELPIKSPIYEIESLQPADNGRNISCQVNNNFTLHENVVLTSNYTTLQVEYDPVVRLEQMSADVIEGHSLSLRCTATGYPSPAVTWYRGSTAVTGSTVSSSTYIIMNINRTSTGNYSCKAYSSSTGTNTLQPDQKSLYLTVFYPPTVSLLLQNTTENTINHVIKCSAVGDPDNSTVVALQQRIGSVSIRNFTRFTESSPGNVTLNIPKVSYQDMGTYTCLASNGIPDRSNQKIQSDTAYLNVKTSAKFEMMQYIVRSDIDTPAVAEISFYINPPANESDVVWTSNIRSSNETLVSSANVSLFLGDTDVQQRFHGVDVKLKGQSAIMNITSFQSYYERNYTLQIRSSYTDSAEVTVIFIRSGPPDTPSNFLLLTRKVTGVVLTWNKGSDGGHQQTFVILYREKTAEVYDVKQIVDTTANVTITYEIKHLKSDTSYEFMLYSFNKKGNSSHHKILEERTLKETSQSSLNSGLVGGAAGGGAALLVIIAVLAVVLKRRHNKREDNNSKGILNGKEMSAGPSKQSDEDEGGLKDNPLYGSSPGGANAVQGASAAPENLSHYAAVVKPKKKTLAKESVDPPPIYAEVDKSKKKGKGLMKLKKQSPPRVGEDPPPIYAEVDKSNKKNGKGKQQKQKTTTGDVYEVVDGFKEKETQFKDPAVAQKNKEGGQRGYRNQDGLLYVDVKFDQPPPTGKPIIRGEERTGYAMIEFEEPPTYSTADDVQGEEGGE